MTIHSAHLATIADRKALLVTRAQLDRARITLAVHEIKAIAFPALGTARSAALRPTAAMIVGFAAPLLGMTRFARWVRFGSLALTVWRIARGWRGPS